MFFCFIFSGKYRLKYCHPIPFAEIIFLKLFCADPFWTDVFNVDKDNTWKSYRGRAWKRSWWEKKICCTSGFEVREAFKADPRNVGTNCPKQTEWWAPPAVAVSSVIWKMFNFLGGGRTAGQTQPQVKNCSLGTRIGKDGGGVGVCEIYLFSSSFFLREEKQQRGGGKRRDQI